MPDDRKPSRRPRPIPTRPITDLIARDLAAVLAGETPTYPGQGATIIGGAWSPKIRAAIQAKLPPEALPAFEAHNARIDALVLSFMLRAELRAEYRAEFEKYGLPPPDDPWETPPHP